MSAACASTGDRGAAGARNRGAPATERSMEMLFPVPRIVTRGGATSSAPDVRGMTEIPIPARGKRRGPRARQRFRMSKAVSLVPWRRFLERIIHPSIIFDEGRFSTVNCRRMMEMNIRRLPS
jgi:hypothetical protein